MHDFKSGHVHEPICVPRSGTIRAVAPPRRFRRYEFGKQPCARFWSARIARFRGAPAVASWKRGALLDVGLNDDAKISSVSLIPVVLEDGLPRFEMVETNRFGSR